MAASVKKHISDVCRRYLVHFANVHAEFRLAELKSLTSLFNIEFKITNENFINQNPFLIIDLPSEKCAQSIMSRTVLIRSIYELWASGSSNAEVYDAIKILPREILKPYQGEDVNFKVVIETYNKSLKQSDKLNRIHDYCRALDLKGKVNLSKPDVYFTMLEYYGREGSDPTPEPLAVYAGRWVADGQRDLIKDFHLQKRQFIANTSMDAGLSMLMANMARVKKSDIVIDPFVGSGSLLVACAQQKAYVIGTDIDFLLLHGRGRSSRHNQMMRGPDESIKANLRQYNLEDYYLDVLVADASKQDLYRSGVLFDAIITDPPYGIREPTKKVGTMKENVAEITDEMRGSHVPSKLKYMLADIFKDLLNFAARFLKVGGRLVYWLPVFRPEYTEANVPVHPCLELLSNCEQPITTHIGRRLITMEKIKELQKYETAETNIDLNHFQDWDMRQRYFKIDNPESTGSKRREKRRAKQENL